MADQGSTNKTEQPTPKRKRDARQRGDIAKSRDATNTALLAMGLVIAWQLGPTAADSLKNFTNLVLNQSLASPMEQIPSLGLEAVRILLTVSAMIVIPMALLGVVCEFLQIGPLLTLDKVKPKLSNLNIVSGIGKMVSMDSFVEVLKSIAKLSVIFFLGSFTAYYLLPNTLRLPASTPESLTKLMQSQTVMVVGAVATLFITISLLDLVYQKYSQNKKLMMSMDEIKTEHKSTDGDPQIKAHRKQMAREWSEEAAMKKTKDATVLLVNPTHIAIAINYDKETVPVPVVSVSGIDNNAQLMRRAALEAKVPVLKNIPLARSLLSKTDDGDLIPKELFDIMSEVIIWAQSKDRTQLDAPGEEIHPLVGVNE